MHPAPYGFECVLDLHSCDVSRFNRPSIDQFFTELCDLIEMEKCEVHFWDDIGVLPEEQQTLPHTKGTSAVCFILTSSIVIHTLDLMGQLTSIFSHASRSTPKPRANSRKIGLGPRAVVKLS
jgi:S-adenosylmethionine/arginine decarboxylase-like enzyme